MRMIYLPMAAALAIGLTAAAPTTASADSAAFPEDNRMQHMRDSYYGGNVYVAPTYRTYTYRDHYGYPHRPYYYRSDRYHRHYHRPLFGLQLPFVGLHLG